MFPHSLFAYGSLRPGESGFGLIASSVVDSRPAVLPDHALYGRGLPYPLVVPEPGDRVIGDVLRIDAADLTGVLESLDRYEGPRYRRVTAAARLGEAIEPVWVFVAAAGPLADDLRIPGGDWLATRREGRR